MLYFSVDIELKLTALQIKGHDSSQGHLNSNQIQLVIWWLNSSYTYLCMYVYTYIDI